MNTEAEDIHLPVNLGNPNEFTMNELAQEVAKTLKKNITISNKPLPQDDPQKRQPNIERATQLLNWQPEISLKEGLEKTVGYFSQQINS